MSGKVVNIRSERCLKGSNGGQKGVWKAKMAVRKVDQKDARKGKIAILEGNLVIIIAMNDEVVVNNDNNNNKKYLAERGIPCGTNPKSVHHHQSVVWKKKRVTAGEVDP